MRPQTGTRLLVALGALLFPFSDSGARPKETHCRWKTGITEERLDDSDEWLYEHGDPRIETAVREHLPAGLPGGLGGVGSNEFLLAQPHYVIWYDSDLRTPLWTAHHLSRFEAGVSGSSHQGEKRRDSFRSDPRLGNAERAECSDYKEPIFDQGHMVPNADLDFVTPGMDHSLGMDHSFLISNMTPQHCAFNRGPWQVLEGLVRKWATDADDTWVITGAVLDRDDTEGRDADSRAWRMKGNDGNRRVAIPSHQYKIIAQWDGDGWQLLTLVIENTDHLITSQERDDYLGDRVSSLAEVETLTGLSFYDGASVEESEELWTATSFPALLSFGCDEEYPEK